MMCDKCLIRSDRGSMTVEAAVIIPMLLVISIMVIYAFLFGYNSAAAWSAAGRAAVRAAGMEQDGGKVIEKKVSSFLELETERLPMAADTSSQVKVSLVRIKTGVSGRQPLNVRLPGTVSALGFDAKVSVQRLDPAKYIWTIRIGKKLVNKAEGGGSVKDAADNKADG